MKQKSFAVFIVLCTCIWCLGPVSAQDLEPRRWTPLPEGTNVLGVAYGRSSGDVFFDPVLHLEDVDVDVDSYAVSYVRSFSLAGKLARFDVLLPWQSARWEGLLNGAPASTERRGFADPRFRLSMNLLGAPAAGPAELGKYLASHPINTVVGAALSVTVPLGEYYEDKLLNLGENRFVIRPQIGMVHSRGPWSFELTGSIFFFTDNDEFFRGNMREQDPIYAMQTHVVRVFSRGLWASLSAGYGRGGESSINGVSKDDKRENILTAVSAGFPLAKNQGVKMVYLRARTQTDTGSDMDHLLFAWSLLY